jgi:hypothetical protein
MPAGCALTLSRMQVIRCAQRGVDLWLTVSGWIWVCYALLVAAAVSLAL